MPHILPYKTKNKQQYSKMMWVEKVQCTYRLQHFSVPEEVTQHTFLFPMESLHGKTALELFELSRSEESQVRCESRHERCPGDAKQFLKKMDEGTALWYGL